MKRAMCSTCVYKNWHKISFTCQFEMAALPLTHHEFAPVPDHFPLPPLACPHPSPLLHLIHLPAPALNHLGYHPAVTLALTKWSVRKGEVGPFFQKEITTGRQLDR